MFKYTIFNYNIIGQYLIKTIVFDSWRFFTLFFLALVQETELLRTSAGK